MIKRLLVLMCLSACYQAQANEELAGYADMVKDIDRAHFRLMYKLTGNTYRLKYHKAGDWELRLEPERLFEIEKLNGSEFQVTLNDPRFLREKHGENPFKIKWFIEGFEE